MRLHLDRDEEGIDRIWSALHLQSMVHVCRDELDLLERIATEIADRITAGLLSRKLRAARIVGREALPPRTVRLGSLVEFSTSRRVRFGQLAAPCAGRAACAIGIDSLVGAGLLGLTAGQAILWPDRQGRLGSLQVHHVSIVPGVLDWGQPDACAAHTGSLPPP